METNYAATQEPQAQHCYITNEIKVRYFCLAIKEDWTEDVVMFIRDNPTIVDVVYNKTTPFLVAIMTNKLHIVQMLLDANVDVNNPHCVTTPLVAAVLIGNIDLVTLLINHGACLDGTCQAGTCQAGTSQDGISKSRKCRDSNDLTAIHAAMEMDNQPITELLLQHMTTIDTSMMMCAVKSSPAILETVHQFATRPSSKHHVEVNVDMLHVLQCAIKENCVYSVSKLVQSPLVGVAVLSDPSLMEYAIQHGNVSIMNVLGQYGAEYCI